MSSVLGGHADEADSGDKGLGERRGVISIRAPKTQKGGKTVNLISLGRQMMPLAKEQNVQKPNLKKSMASVFGSRSALAILGL